MEHTKETFKEELKRLKKLAETDDISDYEDGKLTAMILFENLILFGVGSSKPIKEEIDFIIYDGKKFVHKTDLEAFNR